MTNGITRRFKPTLWPTVFSIPVFFLALYLGTWQVERLEWKKEQIILRTERSTAEPISFTETFPGEVGDPGKSEFLNVWLEGEFRYDKEFYMGARALDERLGFQIITPFVMTDGRQILFNRGFVPSDMKNPDTRKEGQVTGKVKVAGLLRVAGWKGYDFVRPENDLKKNFWFYVDIDAMSRAADLTNPVQNIYVEAGPAANPGGYPLGGQTRITLPNNHFTYVITWYSMALILAVIYFVFHYRPVEKPDDET